jgi:hypothetical protein
MRICNKLTVSGSNSRLIVYLNGFTGPQQALSKRPLLGRVAAGGAGGADGVTTGAAGTGGADLAMPAGVGGTARATGRAGTHCAPEGAA